MAHRHTGTKPHIRKVDGKWRSQVFANSKLNDDIAASEFVSA